MPDEPPQKNTVTVRWFPTVLLSVAAASGLWVVGSRSLFSAWHGIPNTPMTTCCFLAAAAATNTGVPARYRWSIVAGLGFSAVGDVFLMLPSDRFLPGLGSFLAAHACYLWALTYDTRLAGRRLPFVVWGVLGMVALVWLWPRVGGALRLPVVLYAVVLLAMAAQATGRALSRRDAAAILAAAGAAHFVVSDLVLAVQRFSQPLEWGRVIVLGTYFTAQGGIAMSVVLHRGRTA